MSKTLQDGAGKVLAIEDLRPAPYNPRRIKDKAAKGLAYSMSEFGDIAGITWNAHTGNLVAGHQRVNQGKAAGAKVIDNALVMPNGERFEIRIVDWPLSKERAANVAANNPHIGGEFDDTIGQIIDDIKLDISAEDFETGCFDDLLIQPLDGMPTLPSGDKQPFQQMTFLLHDDQAEQVKAAIDVAKAKGAFVDTGNENSNGNALARICETYLTGTI